MIATLKALFAPTYYIKGKCVYCAVTDLLLYCDAPGQDMSGLGELSVMEILRIADQIKANQ